MTNLKIIIFVTCFLVFPTAIFAQYDKLNLSFENNGDGWLFTVPYPALYLDTVDVVDGKYSLRISDPSTRAFPIPSYFLCNIFQYIQMPVASPEIELSVYSKSERIDEAWVKLYSIDNNEKVLYRDSISILSPLAWNKFQLNIPRISAQRIFLEISMRCNHPVTDKREKELASLLVDNIQIKIDGKEIATYKEPVLKPSRSDSSLICSHVKINPRLPINIDSLPDFKNHRILAFGETMHTSGEVQQFVYEATRSLIEKNNCRLLLLEYPYEWGLRLNAYVNGESDEDVAELLFFGLKDPSRFIPFLKWVRDFNATNSTKVTIMGVDIEPHYSKFYDSLYRLVEKHVPQSKAFQSFSALLMHGKYEKAFSLLREKADSLDMELGHRRYQELYRALQLREEQKNPDYDMTGADRDFTMYQNAKWIIDNYLRNGEQAVVYSHLAHGNTGDLIFKRYGTPAMGKYLKENYDLAYFAVAVTIGSGTIADPSNMNRGTGYQISTSKAGSLENICMLSPDKCFYKNLDGLGSTYSVRVIGNQGRGDLFWPFNHQGRINGVVFIRESTHYKRPDDWPKDVSEYIEKYWAPRLEMYRATEKQKVKP